MLSDTLQIFFQQWRAMNQLLCGKNATMKMTVAKTMFLKGLACPIISINTP